MKAFKFVLVAVIAAISLGIVACSDDEPGSVQGWYRQDGGYIIFKAMNFQGSTVTEYFRVEAENEPDWREWDDAEELPGHSGYYFGRDSRGTHSFTVDGNRITFDDGRVYTKKGNKLIPENGGDDYRKW